MKIKIFFILSVFFLTSTASALEWKEGTDEALKNNCHRLSPKSLNRYGYCQYSQFGEDGIIEEIFNRLNISEGYCVEFGGADGVWLSNIRRLIEKGWKGCFIESSKKAFKKLRKNYQSDENVLCLNQFITWNQEDQRGMLFDQIRKEHFPDIEIDFLSIDIDGADFYILKSLECRPKVICIECGLLWHPLFAKEVPEDIAIRNIHQPVQVAIDEARKMGYEPICMTNNLFLVRKDLYEPFMDVPSNTLTLWRDAFRVSPCKEGIIKKRNRLKVLKEMEGSKINQQLPIRVDF
ncbi:MAG: hypothetical protein WDZ28_03975 [Simkaniaceae bacterium]